jgi:hypothetical protein
MLALRFSTQAGCLRYFPTQAGCLRHLSTQAGGVRGQFEHIVNLSLLPPILPRPFVETQMTARSLRQQLQARALASLQALDIETVPVIHVILPGSFWQFELAEVFRDTHAIGHILAPIRPRPPIEGLSLVPPMDTGRTFLQSSQREIQRGPNQASEVTPVEPPRTAAPPERLKADVGAPRWRTYLAG